MTTDRLDPVFVRAQIDLVRVTCPQIWDDSDVALRIDMLEAETNLHAFVSAVVHRMLEAAAFAGGIDALIIDLKARRDRFDQRETAMRTLAFKVMTWAEVKRLELTQATLSIRAGQPKVIVTDEAALPIDCVRIKREPDKTAIKEHFARGDSVPGAELSNSEPTLAVRVK